MTKTAARPIVKYLRAIAKKNGGLLKPEDVVEAARSTTSILHDKFTWDDGEAARHYRLVQARRLIAVTVSYIEVDGKDQSFRVFCSLSPDRQNEGGGYREVTAVLRSKTMREQLLADAMSELRTFEQKYKTVRELTGVLSEIRKVLATEEESAAPHVAA